MRSPKSQPVKGTKVNPNTGSEVARQMRRLANDIVGTISAMQRYDLATDKDMRFICLEDRMEGYVNRLDVLAGALEEGDPLIEARNALEALREFQVNQVSSSYIGAWPELKGLLQRTQRSMEWLLEQVEGQ